MVKELIARNKKIKLPIFMPDATRGVIRGLDSDDLKNDNVEGLVTNTYHLSNNPGSTVLEELGGLAKFMNWDGLLVTDSGGFQLLSIVYQDPSLGKISDKGVTFYKKTANSKKKISFTPEKSIQMQFRINSDVMVCLDDCPREGCSDEENETSVNRTIEWAKRCKEEFERQCESRKLDEKDKPLLFAVIQGGDSKQQRESCYKKFSGLDFDGYGFGGWPLNPDKSLNTEILSFTASLIPDDKYKYALGVGTPDGIVECFKMGYSMFDCVLPTRDGRHGRIYVLNEGLSAENVLSSSSTFSHMHILEEKYVRDPNPIDPSCDCTVCQGYSRAYLQHLFRINDTLAGRFATIHNLRTYTRLIELLREG